MNEIFKFIQILNYFPCCRPWYSSPSSCWPWWATSWSLSASWEPRTSADRRPTTLWWVLLWQVMRLVLLKESLLKFFADLLVSVGAMDVVKLWIFMLLKSRQCAPENKVQWCHTASAFIILQTQSQFQMKFLIISELVYYSVDLSGALSAQ